MYLETLARIISFVIRKDNQHIPLTNEKEAKYVKLCGVKLGRSLLYSHSALHICSCSAMVGCFDLD